MNPIVKYRNLGTFLIPYDMINALPRHAEAVLQNCIVLGAYRDNTLHYVSYLATHKNFREVEFGTPIPFYTFRTEEINNSGRIRCTWFLGEKSKHVTVPAEMPEPEFGDGDGMG